MGEADDRAFAGGERQEGEEPGGAVFPRNDPAIREQNVIAAFQEIFSGEQLL